MYGAAPFFAHWTPAFPAIIAALALPLSTWLLHASPHLPERLKLAPYAIIALALVVLGFLNVNFYFRDYYARPETLQIEGYRDAAYYLEQRSAQAHYQASLGPAYMVRILGQPEYLNNPDTPYLAPEQDYTAITTPENELPVRPPPGKGLAFLFMPGADRYRDLVLTLHPGGTASEVRSRDGRLLFHTYVIHPQK
jgi:hypothetical protein